MDVARYRSLYGALSVDSFRRYARVMANDYQLRSYHKVSSAADLFRGRRLTLFRYCAADPFRCGRLLTLCDSPCPTTLRAPPHPYTPHSYPIRPATPHPSRTLSHYVPITRPATPLPDSIPHQHYLNPSCTSQTVPDLPHTPPYSRPTPNPRYATLHHPTQHSTTNLVNGIRHHQCSRRS